MRTSFHHQPEAQHPIFQLSTSWQADYPIFWGKADITYIVDRATGRFVMAKKRRVYKPRLVGGKVMMPQT